jgi:hypothetical protein
MDESNTQALLPEVDSRLNRYTMNSHVICDAIICIPTSFGIASPFDSSISLTILTAGPLRSSMILESGSANMSTVFE